MNRTENPSHCDLSIYMFTCSYFQWGSCCSILSILLSVLSIIVCLSFDLPLQISSTPLAYSELILEQLFYCCYSSHIFDHFAFFYREKVIDNHGQMSFDFHHCTCINIFLWDMIFQFQQSKSCAIHLDLLVLVDHMNVKL